MIASPDRMDSYRPWCSPFAALRAPVASKYAPGIFVEPVIPGFFFLLGPVPFTVGHRCSGRATIAAFSLTSSEMTRRASRQTIAGQAMQDSDTDSKKFHGWRLLGIIFIVVVTLAVASAVVDWVVIGPLEGRAF